jgi:hypothetical protein
MLILLPLLEDIMPKKTRKLKDLEALNYAIRTDKLDGRTSEAKEVARIKQGLTDTPIATAKRLLKDIAARDLMIEKLVYHAAINGPDPLLDTNGKIHPIIDKTMLKFQGAGKSALLELIRLEGGAKPNESEDIFDDIFETDQD